MSLPASLHGIEADYPQIVDHKESQLAQENPRCRLERVKIDLADRPEAMKYRHRKRMARKMQNAPFKFGPADWVGFFKQPGWEPREIRYLADEGERLRRPIPLPRLVKAAMKFCGLFVSKNRRDALRKFAGYVLLEPC